MFWRGKRAQNRITGDYHKKRNFTVGQIQRLETILPQLILDSQKLLDQYASMWEVLCVVGDMVEDVVGNVMRNMMRMRDMIGDVVGKGILALHLLLLFPDSSFLFLILLSLKGTSNRGPLLVYVSLLLHTLTFR